MKELKDYVLCAKRNPSKRKLLLAQFIDDFRRSKDLKMITTPITKTDQLTQLFVATAHQLAIELKLKQPLWLTKYTPLKHPYFISQFDGLKLLALRDSPYSFRVRNIYVLGNFLSRR